jgi:N-acetylglucosamine kinase-like BadF-type ATPase
MFVGVDAGGSHTVAAAQRDAESPRVAERGPANARVAGIAAAVDAIATAIESVLGDEAATSIAVGAAGAAESRIAAALREGLMRRFPGVTVDVGSDTLIALRAAVPEGDGVVLVAGTGSVAMAHVEGKTVRAGGAGFAIGDDGSGYAIGAAALKLLFRHFEGRAPADELTVELARHIGAAQTGDVLEYVYGGGAPVTAVASIAPQVVAAANAGVRSAAKIVQTAAAELFELVKTVCGANAVADRSLPLVFAGGLLSRNSMLTYLVETRIANDFPHLRVVKDAVPAYIGALTVARRIAKDAPRR